MQVLWTPPEGGAPEPYMRIYTEDGKGLQSVYAHHRDEQGRRYFWCPDTPKNRAYIETMGERWSILDPDPRRDAVINLLIRLGIAHKKSMSTEALIAKLPKEYQ